MKQVVIIAIIVSFYICYGVNSSAYLTENAIGQTLTEAPLRAGNGNVPGTHKKFTEYSINNLDYKPGVQRALKDVAGTILQGNSDEDDGYFANALRHFYNPNLPDFQRGLLNIDEENAKAAAIEYYKGAKELYSRNPTAAWDAIGRALHLLQDMAVPSHVHRANHFEHSVFRKTGYEWWVARFWDDNRTDTGGRYQGFLLKPYIDFLMGHNPYFTRPIVAGNMGGYMDAMAVQSFYGYEWDEEPIPFLGGENKTVSDEEAKHTASVLVPAAIAIGGGLLQGFCLDVGCVNPFTLPADNRTPGHPDDNFDVASRLIELKELDVTKQAWKDLYGRTGIKKGYNGLALEKMYSEAYAKIASLPTEAEYKNAMLGFQAVYSRAQKEIRHSFEETYYASADVALLSDAFVDNAAELLLKRLKEPIREVKETFSPAVLLKNQPVLLIPSGALTGFNDSALLKASLDEYVKSGGTLIVLSQKHGYDYAAVPTPDGKPITGYGWEEDQNCFADSVAIENWHQIFSGQSRPTPTVNVDGYFTGYPANSTILLRRTANGQPALLMYEHGAGRVIVTSMYSDWAYGHGQASQEEIALVRDMLSWAKKPAALPEIKPGESIAVPVTFTNSTASDAATVKLQIWTPDRGRLLSEQTLSLPVAAGQAATQTVTWQAPSSAALGIYHIDYILLDAAGTVIQPQAETDSGRFVVSKPPQTGTVKKDIWLSITSPNQQVFFGEPFAYNFHLFNNSAVTRNLTIRTVLPHTGRTHEYQVTATANGETVISGSDPFIDGNMFETLHANLYDENNVGIGSYMLTFKAVFPQVTVTTAPAKQLYTRGEKVDINVNLGNRQALATTVKLVVTVTDPANSVFFSSSADVLLPASGQDSRNFSLLLPKTAKGGVYTVSSEVLAIGGKKVGGDSVSFELPLSQIAVTPQLPAAWSAGNNTVTFSLLNTGATAINSGVLDVSLKDPDGLAAGTVALPFTMEPGQVKMLSASFSLPSLKFGRYTLSYVQRDENVSATATTVTLENSVAMTASFDKPSYRIRESVRYSLGLANAGRFNSGSLAVTVSLPDAGFAETRNIALTAGGSASPEFTIMLPAAMAAGRHSLVATVALPSGNMVSLDTFVTIPDPFLAVDEPASFYQSGTAATMPLRNTGGIDTAVDSTFTLYDSGDRLIASKTDSGVITAGGERMIALSIPAQAADGSYRLLRVYKGPDGQLVESLRNVRINGVMATMAAATSKQVFLSSENVGSLANIVNQGAAIDGATLDLQVLPTARATYLDSWGQENLWTGVKQFIDTDSLPKSMQLEHYIRNGDFEYGNATGWQKNSINGGDAFLAVEGARWSGYPTENIVINGKYAIGIRSNGEGSVSSGVVVTSEPFIPVENTINWVQLSESSVVYVEARILDINGNILKTVPLPIVTGVFGAQQLDVSQYKGQTIRIAFMQHTYQWGFGWYTLLDDIRNGNAIYQTSGIFESETRDYGAPVEFSTISWLANTPAGTAVKFQIAANNDNATWQFVGPDGTAGTYYESSGLGISPYHNGNRYMRWRASLETTNPSTTPILHNLTIGASEATSRILWQNSRLISVASGSIENVSSVVGTLGTTGKMILQAALQNSIGQTIAVSTYPFYLASGTAALLYSPDKALYKPGETVTISGEVRNLTSVDLANLNLVITGKPATGAGQTLYSSIIAVPAGGSRPFSVTATAGAEGAFALTGTVTQNASTLAQIADQYEVVSPKATTILTVPDVAGNDQFTTTLELKNSGKVEAVITVGKSFDQQPETVTIPVGQTRLLQYSRQISADTTDSFTLSGDLMQTFSKTIKYGTDIALAVEPQALYPEGKVSLPLTVTNSGLIDSQFPVNYQLSQGTSSLGQQSKSYFLPKGTSSSDRLSYDLSEGSYQLTATSQRPAASAVASFQVRKATKAELALSTGAQSAGLLSATVSVTNLGYLPIEGSVRVSLINNDGAIAWTADQEASLLQSPLPVPSSFTFNINLAPLKPGSYTIKAELLDAGNRQLAFQSAPFSLIGPVIAISQLPQSRTIPSGGSSDFIFKVKNSGNQEGQFDLSFKADDLINATRSEWLKPGEEKELSFTLQAAADLDEKDYFATYGLKSSGSGSEERGTVKYHLQGLNLAVTASLDRQAYNDGDSASFTLNVTQQNAGAAPSLFARVNYNGYNEKQSFTLTGSQALVFNVPLTQITGEKLFYGIYTESGRSIHLNTIYVRKADAALAIATGKQVYNPGETVVAAISGTVSGDLTLTGPGDFTTTFAYSGSDTKSFVLPQTMTAGTYTIKAQLKTPDAGLITASYPFDVAGIQVKVKEALLDKPKYAAIDTMRLNLTIESNRDIPATVRTWIVGPAGAYTEAGSGDAALTAAAPTLITLNSQLSTASLGIHKLVYGIYQGDLLLASGAKAFDMGDAVLTALTTDKNDYAAVAVPVIVKADFFGSIDAGIELLLDGSSIKTDTVSLAGFTSKSFSLPPEALSPGMHTVKAVLISGGLTSSRETRFTWGSSLPDLTLRLAAGGLQGSMLPLTIAVTNQGKTAAAASSAALYDGDPSTGGQLLAVLSIPAIPANGSATLAYDWNVLGRAGEHTLYAVVDPANQVAEFMEGNNRALTVVSLPSLALAVSTTGVSFKANSEVGVTTGLTNLSAAAMQGLSLKLEISGVGQSILKIMDGAVAPLAAASEAAYVMGWNSGSSAPGLYTINAFLSSGGVTLATASSGFVVEPDVSLTGSFTTSKDELMQGASLNIDYTLTNNGNLHIASSQLLAEFVDINNGRAVLVVSQEVAPVAVSATIAGSLIINRLDVPPGDYMLRLSASTAGSVNVIGERTIKVLPPLSVTTSLSAAPRLLIYVAKPEERDCRHHDGFHCDAERFRPDVVIAAEALGIPYRLAHGVKAFKTELRSGLYNVIALGESFGINRELRNEIAERVNAGDGLIVFGQEGLSDPVIQDLAGVKISGRLKGSMHRLLIMDPLFTQTGETQITGRIDNVVQTGANARIIAVTLDNEQRSPAIVLNQYGAGKVVYFAIEPDKSLLGSAFTSAAPSDVDPVAATPLPLEFVVKGAGEPFDLKVSQLFSRGVPLLMAIPAGEQSEQGMVWTFALARDMEKRLMVLRKAPETGGKIDSRYLMEYLKGGVYQPYGEYGLDIVIERSVTVLKDDILSALQKLPVKRGEGRVATRLVSDCLRIAGRNLQTREDAERAISDLLELISNLRKLSVDFSAIRLDLDRLLKVYERLWVEMRHVREEGRDD